MEFKYGAPDSVLSENGYQFASKFFLLVRFIMGIGKVLGSTYHPQTNNKTESFTRTVLEMQLCYTNEDQRDWDHLMHELTHALNNSAHITKGCKKFELAFTRQPSIHTVEPDIEGDQGMLWKTREDFEIRLDVVMECPRHKLGRPNYDTRGNYITE